MDEFIRRLDIITDIVVIRCNTIPFSRSQGEYDFNKQILMQSLNEFQLSAPILIIKQRQFNELKNECLYLFEYIELNTPVESVDSINIQPDGTMYKALETTLRTHFLASKVTNKIYSLI